MENKIHWRKMISNTSIKEKNDGQKAGSRERIGLVACSLMVTAPPHLQNSTSQVLMSHMRGVTAPAHLREPPGNSAGAVVPGEC